MFRTYPECHTGLCSVCHITLETFSYETCFLSDVPVTHIAQSCVTRHSGDAHFLSDVPHTIVQCVTRRSDTCVEHFLSVVHKNTQCGVC
jgi:hypothetical protein